MVRVGRQAVCQVDAPPVDDLALSRERDEDGGVAMLGHADGSGTIAVTWWHVPSRALHCLALPTVKPTPNRGRECGRGGRRARPGVTVAAQKKRCSYKRPIPPLQASA